MQITKQSIQGPWQEFRESRSIKTRNLLVELYRPVVSHACKYAARFSEFSADELESSGTIGLIMAIETFPENADVMQFRRYCHRRIHGEIRDFIREHNALSRGDISRIKAGGDSPWTERLQMHEIPEPLYEPSDFDLAEQVDACCKILDKAMFDSAMFRQVHLHNQTVADAAASLGLNYGTARAVYARSCEVLRDHDGIEEVLGHTTLE